MSLAELIAHPSLSGRTNQEFSSVGATVSAALFLSLMAILCISHSICMNTGRLNEHPLLKSYILTILD